MQDLPENEVLQTPPIGTAPSPRLEPESASKVNGYSTPPHTPPLPQRDAVAPASEPAPTATKNAPSNEHEHEHGHDRDLEHAHEDDDAVVVVQSVQAVHSATPQAISKPRIVNVPKRVPPQLPPRNPNRAAVAGAGGAAAGASLSPELTSDEPSDELVTPVGEEEQDVGPAEEDGMEPGARPVSPSSSSSSSVTKPDSGNVALGEKGGEEDEESGTEAAEKMEEIRLEDHEPAEKTDEPALSAAKPREEEGESAKEGEQTGMPGGW